MPFVDQSPKPFMEAEISRVPADATGVYGLQKPGVWIYVGRGEIKNRLLDHLNGDNRCITFQALSTFVYEVRALDEARERVLIRELDPVCNQRVG